MRLRRVKWAVGDADACGHAVGDADACGHAVGDADACRHAVGDADACGHAVGVHVVDNDDDDTYLMLHN